jgi:hypothetical protein
MPRYEIVQCIATSASGNRRRGECQCEQRWFMANIHQLSEQGLVDLYDGFSKKYLGGYRKTVFWTLSRQNYNVLKKSNSYA